MTDIRQRAEKLVVACSISPCVCGFDYIVDAVQSVALRQPIKNVKSELCKKYNKNPKSLLHNIDYAVSSAANLKPALSAIVGIDIPDDQIRSWLVISYLGIALRSQLDTVQ